MSPLDRNDIKISVLVGFIAGLLIIPTLHNIGVNLNFQKSVLAIAGLMIFTPTGYLIAYWLSRWWPVMIQFVKFGITGGLNSMIDFGVLNLLIYIFGIAGGIWYSVFKSISFAVAVTNSYFWNKYWVFSAGGGSSSGGKGQAIGEFIKFFLVNLVGFSINVGAASFIVNVIGTPAGISGPLWANIGAASSVFITLFWNFFGSKFIVFKR